MDAATAYDFGNGLLFLSMMDVGMTVVSSNSSVSILVSIVLLMDKSYKGCTCLVEVKDARFLE